MLEVMLYENGEVWNTSSGSLCFIPNLGGTDELESGTGSVEQISEVVVFDRLFAIQQKLPIQGSGERERGGRTSRREETDSRNLMSKYSPSCILRNLLLRELGRLFLRGVLKGVGSDSWEESPRVGEIVLGFYFDALRGVDWNRRGRISLAD